MFGALGRLKYSLSHINDQAWHYKVVTSFIFSKYDIDDSKACTYYWLKLPFSLFLLGCLSIIMVIAGLAGLFVGRIISPSSRAGALSNQPFYPYKTLPNGRSFPVAPWEVVAVALALYGLYYLAFINPELGILIGSLAAEVIVGLLLLGALIFAFSKGSNNPAVQKARQAVKDAWNKACPNLEVEHKKKDKKDK